MQRFRIHWHSHNLQDTEKLARQMAALMRQGDVITLSGDLGAGKTAFARAFIRALPGGRQQDVTSPTFTILQTYQLDGVSVWHYDLYRLEMTEELYELGLEDALSEAITLIEWPEKAEYLLPDTRIALTINHGKEEQERECELSIPARLVERFASIAGQDGE